ncbi:MAG TPA: shikimate dehydrogenase [Planctomycetaceae bacterium]|nr:shikimate dehydrogenase [Planctomycetaceae bacterium]
MCRRVVVARPRVREQSDRALTGVYSKVTSKSLQPILALMGYPVGGNPIQYMSEKAFARHGLDWRYVSLEIHPDDLSDAIRGMKVMGFLGGNVADPHKEAIVPLLDGLGPTAERTGLVNLIRRDENRLVGENTEGKALVDLLRVRFDLAGRRVVLLGAGHVARAIAVELADAGAAEIVVLDRVEQRAVELAEILAKRFDVSSSPVPWGQDYLVPAEIDVLINATSAAQDDPDTPLAVNLENLDSRATVVDTTIDPPDTWLLQQARQHGCATLDGVSVFTNQIFLNCRMWTGVEPDRSLLREAIEEFLEL